MPRDVVLKIGRDIVAVHAMPDVIARLPGMGLEPGTLNADEFATYYRSEIEKYARVVKGAGIPAMD